MPADPHYPVPDALAKTAHIDEDRYAELYARSLRDSDAFWAEQAESLIDWFRPWDDIQRWDFHEGEINWFLGAKINVAYNCIDRHLEKHAGRTAIIWESDDPAESRRISYADLHDEVCRFANALKGIGAKKGDRICIYMPMIPEAAVAMLACARIGAIHSIVFGGFSPDALKQRINDAECSLIITADQGLRGGRKVPLKSNADAACEKCPTVKRMVVVQRGGDPVAWKDGRDLWYHELISGTSSDCPAVEMDAEDPLFILYTSGTAAAPRGVIHTCGGYLLYTAMSFKYVFDHQEGDIHWCAADIGWITGHSYLVYGPLAQGATTVMFEGIPTWPDAGRLWQIIEKHRVNTFYTAPTTIRALMAKGNEPVTATDRGSLRLLGSVGEPINPEAWAWYYQVVGNARCPIVDTWWQTETGGIVLSVLPGATALKPGSTGKPFFGIEPVLLDDTGNEVGVGDSGNMVLGRAWPGMARSIYGNHERFRDAYFARYPGYYFTGDGARLDEDGQYWITGRVDDVLTVSGRRLGTTDIENALVKHSAVAEAAVVGYPHESKGQGIYAYVTLMNHVEPSEELKHDLITHVCDEMGSSATPDQLQWAPTLPKTRSGKIMRRLLRKIAENDVSDLGDLSTLADPGAVDDLLENR